MSQKENNSSPRALLTPVSCLEFPAKKRGPYSSTHVLYRDSDLITAPQALIGVLRGQPLDSKQKFLKMST